MYNPKNYKEIVMPPPDTILEGVIINIHDGKVADFISADISWKGDRQKTGAIVLDIEVKYNNNIIKLSKLFTYNEIHEGQLIISQKSNLGRYKKRYGKLPEVGDKIKLLSNSGGYLTLMF